MQSIIAEALCHEAYLGQCAAMIALHRWTAAQKQISPVQPHVEIVAYMQRPVEALHERPVPFGQLEEEFLPRHDLARAMRLHERFYRNGIEPIGLDGIDWLAGAEQAIVAADAVCQPARLGAECGCDVATNVLPLVHDAIRRPKALVLLPRVAGPSAASISSRGADMSGAG